MMQLPHPKYGKVISLELERQWRKNRLPHPSIYSTVHAVGNAQVQLMLLGVHVGFFWYSVWRDGMWWLNEE